MREPTLRVERISKAFGGIRAVVDVSFDVSSGSITSLIGPNGAGKTTCFNLITGSDLPDAGAVSIKGGPVTGRLPHEIAALGLARTFQHPRLFQHMTVLENVSVGCHLRPRAGIGFLACALRLPGARRAQRQALEDAAVCLERVGLARLAGRDADELTTGQQRLVEVARALAGQPDLLLLDEPAAGLNDRETELLGELLATLRTDGLGMLVVEHNMDLVMSISDSVVVLDHGEKIAEGMPSVIQNDPRVLEAYLGIADLAAASA